MIKYLTEGLALNLFYYLVIGIGFAAVLALSGLLMPLRSSGSILYVDGRPVGAEYVAQGFSRPEFLWPRPSAVDYDGAGAGGSNLSPAGEEFRKNAEGYLAAYEKGRVPVELVTASGSGLDPHISLEATAFQWPRIVQSRNLGDGSLSLEDFLKEHPEIVEENELVNVLKFNLQLQASFGRLQ